MVERKKRAGELALVGGKRPRMQKPRKGGWTQARREAFLAALSETCNIAAALRKVRMGRSGLDSLRARDAGFRAQMRAAVRHAYPTLELFALEKMMNGTIKTVTRADGSVETVHEYPLALAVQLLRLHKETAGEPEESAAGADSDEVVARLLRKIAAVRARRRPEGGPDDEGAAS